jgi:hypothetical protein
MSASEFFHIFLDNPVLIGLVLLVLLVTVAPLAAGLYAGLRRRKLEAGAHRVEGRAQVEQPPTTRFLGAQFDLAILVVGLLLLFVVAGWIRQSFFR